eukprot:TRINITY_DN865_c0_g1_i2.p1 TRINITY_DN865_c0_g1~~TRINITY_DN865_c0_g1_i2.p1  ORF type:complete len:774 (+),score=211.78 TRINITY_DN865_c0_g1_i2:47-2323(+)
MWKNATFVNTHPVFFSLTHLPFDSPSSFLQNTVDSHGGGVWSISVNNNGIVAAACEDGSVRLFGYTPDSERQGEMDPQLQYLRSCTPTKSRVLSVDFDKTGHFLVSGSGDGLVKKWNVNSGRCKLTIKVEKHSSSILPVVWAVKYLDENTIVSGDSNGNTQFWDAKHGTLVDSFNEHEADVMALASNHDGSIVVSSGIDNSIAMFRRTTKRSKSKAKSASNSSDTLDAADNDEDGEEKTSQRWVFSSSRRPHSHDIRALAISQHQQSSRQVILSAGVDTQICMLFIETFSKNIAPLRYSPFPLRSVIRLCQQNSWMLVYFDHHLELWDMENTPSRLAEIKLKGDLNTMTAEISPNGRWIAVSDISETKLFYFVKEEFRFIKVDLPASLENMGAQRLAFAMQDTMLIAAMPGALVSLYSIQAQQTDVVDEDSDSNSDSDESDLQDNWKFAITKVRTFSQHQMTQSQLTISQHDDQDIDTSSSLSTKTALNGYPAMLDIVVSSDSQWFASLDSNNCVHIFNIDSMQYHDTMARFDSSITAMAFHPNGTVLVTVCANNHLSLYDVEDKAQTAWSSENQESLPDHYLRSREKIYGIAFNRARPSTMILYSHAYFFNIDTDKPLGESKKSQKKSASRAKASSFLKYKFLSESDSSAQQQSSSSSSNINNNNNNNSDDSMNIETDGKSSKRSKRKTTKDGDDDQQDNDQESTDSESRNFQMIDAYKPILFLDFADKNEMVVVERPWIRVLSTLPDPLERKMYGE